MLSPERDPRAARARPGRGRPERDRRRRDEVRLARATWQRSSKRASTVVGENRAQDLEAKHAEYGDAFRWHFIGQLQSNKVKVVNRICELVHSLDSDSAARRLEVPALVQVNLAGEESKGGVDAGRARRLPRLRRARPLDDAARRRDARGVPRLVRATARAGRRARPAELSMGTTQDYAVAAEEGATYVRVGSILFRD